MLYIASAASLTLVLYPVWIEILLYWLNSLLNLGQDFTDLTSVSSGSFIPTVTAISASPDLQWMDQSLVSSVAPSHRVHPYSASPPTYTSAMRNRGHSSGRRAKMEQVNILTDLRPDLEALYSFTTLWFWIWRTMHVGFNDHIAFKDGGEFIFFWFFFLL